MGKRDERKGLKAAQKKAGDEDDTKKKKKKQVSTRVKLKRLLDFEMRSAAKGAEDALVNKHWADYYDTIVGESERVRVQSALARSSHPFVVCTLFATFPSILQKHIEKQLVSRPDLTLRDACSITLYLDSAKLAAAKDLRTSLEREARLGRALLNRNTGVLFALRELFVSGDFQGESKVFLDTCADQDSRHAVALGGNNMAACLSLPHGRKVPPFDTPSSAWFLAGGHIDNVFPWSPDAPADAFLDAVLFRAPSTRDGAVEGSKSWKNWRPQQAQELRGAQMKMVMDLTTRLKKDGKLVYLTQSLNPVENEILIMELLANSKGALQLCKPKLGNEQFKGGLRVDDETSPYFVRVHPHLSIANDVGFVFCIIKKTSSIIKWRDPNPITSEDLSLAHDQLVKQSFFVSHATTNLGSSLMQGLAPAPHLLDELLGVETNSKLVVLADAAKSSVVVTTKHTLSTTALMRIPFRFGLLTLERSEDGQLVLADDEAASFMISLAPRLDGLANDAAESALQMASGDGVVELDSRPEPGKNKIGLFVLPLTTSSSSGGSSLIEGTSQSKVRLSKAARKKLKRDPSGVSSEASTSATARECHVIVRIDETDDVQSRLVSVVSSTEWLASCEEQLFTSA